MLAAEYKKGKRFEQPGHSRDSLAHIATAISIIAFATVMLSISIGIPQDHYTSITRTCISCHNDTGFPNDTDNNGIAAPYERPHNDTVMCEDCHGTNPHNLTYMQPDGTFGNRTTAAACPDCHQTGVANFTHAPIIPDPLMHSSNLNNGSLWNLTPNYYWRTENGSCIYCHGDTKHNSIALGKINDLLGDGNNSRNGTLATTTWCAGCHYSGPNTNFQGTQWTPSPPTITVNNTGKPYWVDHTVFLGGGYRDSNCKSCHALNGSYTATSLNYSHSLDAGFAGGLNCTSCHYVGSGFHNIDTDAINASVHSGINNENATSAGVSAINGACWACHDTDGNVANNPPGQVMGDIYNTPKKCTDCHLSSGTYYSQSLTWGGLTVSQHYYSGDTVKAGNSTSNITSCINCHENVSEMLLPNNDPDTGTFAGDGVRLTGGNRSFYHYGKRRTDMRTGTNENCYYCHQNLSTSFQDTMQKPDVSWYIYNHTDKSFPGCNDFCHGQGLIHDISLTKPSLNVSLCKNCHTQTTHNSTMDCWNCHQDRNRTMYRAPAHGMMYPQANGTYLRYSRGTPANCTTCHVYDLFNTAPNTTVRVPTLNHSTDPSSGRKWGNYWNNTSMITACYYCHQSELHKSTAQLLGSVSLIRGSNTFNNPDLANSTWCGNCHYKGSPGYNGSAFTISPPEILNLSGAVPAFASDGTQFYNHSDIGNFTDIHCENCHGSALAGYLNTTLNFSHSVGEGGGGRDCVSCHDINGKGAPINKRIDASAMKQGVHKNLNRNATSSQPLDAINKACWACHGDGSEPAGHPQRYKNPRKCSSDECHSLSQTPYGEPMVYSHFRNASLNNNPENATNYNVTTNEPCENCHINSLARKDTNPPLALVSHYGSKDNLVDSFNCRYCHLDKDNSEDWGNATLINRNRISQIQLEKEGDKLKVSEGEKLYLGEGYFLKLIEISDKRGDALLQLLKENDVVDEFMLGVGTLYKYEKDITIDNSAFKTPVITLNITSIFKGGNGGFIQFEEYRMRKLHTDREVQNDTACYACHLLRHSTEKQRYQVIDRESREPDDIIYYARVYVDLDSENKSKIYFDNEEDVYSQLGSAGKFISYSTPQKYLKEGETWNITDNYYLKLNQDTTDSREAWLTLTINGNVVEEDVAAKGGEFKYTPKIRYRDYTGTNVTVFTAKIDAISQGKQNFIILKDVKAISPEIMKTTANATLMGYNANWLRPSDTFMVGRIPENLHAPNLFTDQRNWADCVMCHDSSRQLEIANLSAISSRLGKHSKLNSDAPNETILSDTIDRTCWACHTGGNEPEMHSPTYVEPRVCKSCHAYNEKPTYGAIDISDEPHASETSCETCHISDSHDLIRFEVSPVIKEPELSATTVRAGETLKLVAMANAGYRMKIRAAEYFVDNMGSKGKGTPLRPTDGTFDSQKEEITADINTSGLSKGEHVIYIHAMERNNRWGVFYPVNFTVSDKLRLTERTRDSTGSVIASVLKTKVASGLGIISMIIALIVAYLVVSRRRY